MFLFHPVLFIKFPVNNTITIFPCLWIVYYIPHIHTDTLIPCTYRMFTEITAK